MRQLTYLSFLLLLLVSCQAQMEMDDVADVEENILDIEQLDGIRHDIAVNILASHYGGYRKGEKATRAARDFTLTPLIIEGDTALYVVQYKKGWEIYSAHKAAHMVLFSSDEGVFDFNDPKMPPALKTLIKNNATVVSRMRDAELDEVDSSWGGYAFCEKDGDKCSISSRNADGTFSIVNSDDVPPGYWVLIESIPVDESVEFSPKLIKTLWDQNEPWNAYSKKLPDYKGNLEAGASGCVPVAVAQYMYFTHYKDGIPKNCVTTATLNSKGDDYIFSGESSTIWDNMARNEFAVNFGFRTDFSALLIGKVGHDMNADYSLITTTVTGESLLTYLKNTYNRPFTADVVTVAKVMDRLENGYPLISVVTDAATSTVHALLIDSSKTTIRKTKHRYGRVRYPLPPETLDRWALDFTDEDGNIIEYAYVKEEISESKSYEISMNWGAEGGRYDNYFYSISAKEWPSGGYNYDKEHLILVSK